MALPEDEAKQTLESQEETSENEVLEPLEVENGEGASDQEGSDTEMEPTAEEALTTALSEVEKFKDLALRAEAEMQNLQR